MRQRVVAVGGVLVIAAVVAAGWVAVVLVPGGTDHSPPRVGPVDLGGGAGEGSGPPEPPRQCGWVADPAAVQRVVREHGLAEFRDTPPFRAAQQQGGWGDGEDVPAEPVLLWEAARRVTGDVLPARDQGTVGSCVAVAAASAIEHVQCVQIDGGEQAVYREVASEVIYGGSRVQVGGGRLRGDGSIGAWAAVWLRDYGVVARGVYGRYDLRRYSEAMCRELGRRGVPPELQAIAREHRVLEVARVRSWEEAQVAVRHGYAVLVCSDQGFRLERDAEGFCPPRGTWYHAMALIGVQGGRRPGGFLLNSWGASAHSGPRVPPDAPPGGFWADARVLDRMLRQGDSWAFGQFQGFAEGCGGTMSRRRPVERWPRPLALPVVASYGRVAAPGSARFAR